VNDKIYASNAYLSSLNLSQTLNTASLHSGSLRIQYTPSLEYNTISTTLRTLYLNNLVTITNTQTAPYNVSGLAYTPTVGIKVLNPLTTLDVLGNAYFSSVSLEGTPRVAFFQLGSEFV
jgi:hypothetical protein